MKRANIMSKFIDHKKALHHMFNALHHLAPDVEAQAKAFERMASMHENGNTHAEMLIELCDTIADGLKNGVW